MVPACYKSWHKPSRPFGRHLNTYNEYAYGSTNSRLNCNRSPNEQYNLLSNAYYEIEEFYC